MCSQLSRTSSVRLPASDAAMPACTSAPRSIVIPNVPAIDGNKDSAVDNGVASTNQAPPSNASLQRRADSMANLVLPDPPDPTSVTKRVRGRRRSSSSSSTARPMNGVRGAGSVPTPGTLTVRAQYQRRELGAAVQAELFEDRRNVPFDRFRRYDYSSGDLFVRYPCRDEFGNLALPCSQTAGSRTAA